MQMNEVCFAGFVGRDSETRMTRNGKPVAGFSLCFTKKAKEGSGFDDESTWVQVSAVSEWTVRDAELVKKGDNVFVKGMLQVRDYKDKTGVDRTHVSVLANSIARIVKAPARDKAPHPADEVAYQAAGEPNTQAISDEEIPF